MKMDDLGVPLSLETPNMFQQDAVPEFGGKKIKLDLKRCDWFENSSSSVPVVNVKVKACHEICVVVMLVKSVLINFYLILRYLYFQTIQGIQQNSKRRCSGRQCSHWKLRTHSQVHPS